MTSPMAANLKKYTLTLCMGSILIFCVFALGTSLLAADQLDVKRDEEKTIYTIGSSDTSTQEKESQTDKAWDILRNMATIMDRRQGKPAQSQPVQPATGK